MASPPQLSKSILEAARQWYIANPKGAFWSSVSVPGKNGQRSKAFHMVGQAESNLPSASNDMYASFCLRAPELSADVDVFSDRRYTQLLRQRGLHTKADVKLSALKGYLAVQAAVIRECVTGSILQVFLANAYRIPAEKGQIRMQTSSRQFSVGEVCRCKKCMSLRSLYS
jgi:hypothetical protein